MSSMVNPEAVACLLSSVAKVQLAFTAVPNSFPPLLPVVMAVVATMSRFICSFHRKMVWTESCCRWSDGWASCSLFATVGTN